MAVLPSPNVDHTSIDFDSLRARLFNVIAQVYPNWTTTDVANVGNILVEMFAFVGDTLGFYMDNRARESRITQAQLRSSVVSLVKLIGYVPIGATAATGEVEVTLADPPVGTFTLPAGSLVRTQNIADPVYFQLTEDAVIAPAADPAVVTVAVEHSRDYAASYASTGLANQEIRLANTPFLDNDSATIAASNGGYTRVDNFLASGPADKHFTIVVDNNDAATIRFGNGSAGALPTGTIDVAYKTGGGASGNVERDTIKRIDGSFTDSLGNIVRVSVNNAVETSGGSARQSRAQIQAQAPASLTTLTRTVGRTDYEVNALRVAGVARALMLTSNQLDSIPENRGRLYVVPAGGGTASSGLRDDVKTMVTVTYPNTITFELDVLTAIYKTIDITVQVYARAGVNKATLAASIRTALTDYFALTTGSGEDVVDNPNVDFWFNAAQNSDGEFDGVIAFSDLYNVVRDVAGVRKIKDGLNGFLVNGAARDLSGEPYEFPVLGVVSVLDAETGTALGS